MLIHFIPIFFISTKLVYLLLFNIQSNNKTEFLIRINNVITLFRKPISVIGIYQMIVVINILKNSYNNDIHIRQIKINFINFIDAFKKVPQDFPNHSLFLTFTLNQPFQQRRNKIFFSSLIKNLDVIKDVRRAL